MAKATRQFADDFDLVAEHYGLKESGEYEEAKQAARNDMAAAQVCFAALAVEIKNTKRATPTVADSATNQKEIHL